MLAAQIDEYGGKEALKVSNDAPVPAISSGQLLIKTRAVGLNPFDWKLREGYFKEFIPLKFPATLGGDVAGVIDAIGDEVKGFEVGQEVYGSANAVGGQGSYAEFVPVKATQLAAKPCDLSMVEAAASPLAGAGAYQALVDTLHLEPGQKILIHGGAGGIGSMAIQIAKHIGADVATTVSKRNVDFAKELGADEIIDYASQDFTRLIKGYDAVFDTVGGDTTSKSFEVLRSGGAMVSMAGEIDEKMAEQHKVAFNLQNTVITSERLESLAKLVKTGALKIFVDKVYPFEQVAEALEYLKVGHPRGKVVVRAD